MKNENIENKGKIDFKSLNENEIRNIKIQQLHNKIKSNKHNNITTIEKIKTYDKCIDKENFKYETLTDTYLTDKNKDNFKGNSTIKKHHKNTTIKRLKSFIKKPKHINKNKNENKNNELKVKDKSMKKHYTILDNKPIEIDNTKIEINPYGIFENTICFNPNKDTITSLIMDNGNNYDISHFTGYLSLTKSQKIGTFRNTNQGFTDNINRFSNPNNTFGYPYRRLRSQYLEINSKDRLEKTKYQLITILSQLNKNNLKQKCRKYYLDNIFITRLYRLYYNCKTHNTKEKISTYHILKKKRYLTLKEFIEIMNYIIFEIKNYNRYLYHKLGNSKYNLLWLINTRNDIIKNAYFGTYTKNKKGKIIFKEHKYRLTDINNKPIRTNRLTITDKQIIPLNHKQIELKPIDLNKIVKTKTNKVKPKNKEHWIKKDNIILKVNPNKKYGNYWGKTLIKKYGYNPIN